MGAVFASAARAPLTSLASVVEMTGDFSLTLPVMLAVAIAATISRALSYATIYTAKLLRRGTDIDRTTPWRALADLKVADAMQPFRPPLTVPPPASASASASAAAGNDSAPDWAALAGPVTGQARPQSLFATESLAQTLRQLEAYGRDGLPVLSPDGQQVEGWVTSASVLRAIAGEISDSQHEAARAQAGAAAGTRRRGKPAAGAARPAVRLSAHRPHRHPRLTRRWLAAGQHHLAAWHRSRRRPARPHPPAPRPRHHPAPGRPHQPPDPRASTTAPVITSGVIAICPARPRPRHRL